MAVVGAWVAHQIGPNMVVFDGPTWSADLDAQILGLFGDGAANLNTPAGWPNGVGPSDLVAGVIPDAVRHLRTTVNVVAESDATIAALAAGVTFDVRPGLAPWQKNIVMHGTPVAPVSVRIEVQYHHSATR